MGNLFETRYSITSQEARPLPDLLEVPIKAFEWFCFDGIPMVFKEVFPIVVNSHKKDKNSDFDVTLTLHFVDHKITLPTTTVRECFDKDSSYQAKLHAVFEFEVEVREKETQAIVKQEIKQQELYICEFPFMTRNGTCVINGVERVVVNQLVRAPGAYFTHGEKRTANERACMVKLIPYRGAWLRFEFDKKTASYYVRMDSPRRTIKIPIMDFIKSMGFHVDEENRIIHFPSGITEDNIYDFYFDEIFAERDKKRRTENMAAFKKSYPNLAQSYALGAKGFEGWQRPYIYIDEHLVPSVEKSHASTMREALLDIWRKLHPTDPPGDIPMASMLPSRFFDQKRYDLHKVGRYMLNKKFDLEVPGDVITLTVPDIVEAFKVLHEIQNWRDGREFPSAEGAIVPDGAKKLIYENSIDKKTPYYKELYHSTTSVEKYMMHQHINTSPTGYLDDIDHLNLENRRVEHIGEQLVNQLRKGLLRVERIVREKLMLPEAENEIPKNLINTRPIIGVIKEFFGSSQMSQFMDNVNPLTSLTHKRRFSALGPKGLTREAARFDFRDVHHSHYGRICPIESPEGPNIGLISSLSAFARVNEYGFIETPFNKVENGVVTEEQVYLSADQELDFAIAPSTTKHDKDGKITDDTLFIRRHGNFEKVSADEINYVEVAPNQFISVTTALIPFLEHDDANRALMGSNMQRQAVPLLYPASPVIGTGIERKLAENAGGLEISPFCGEVTYVDSSKITLRKGVVFDKHTFEILDLPNLEKIEGEETLNKSKFDYMFTPPQLQHEIYRKLPFEDRGFRKLKKTNEHAETIWLRKFQRSNQGTLINQSVQVRKGCPVIKGDLLADSSSTSLGELALGQNCIVAFMSWRGYNFEDAILLSERLGKNNTFTSIHIEKHECEARQTKLGPEKITREITGLHEEYIERNLDDKGIIRVGAEVKSGDVLVGKITPKSESDLTGEEKLIRAVFGDKGKGFKNTPLKVPHGADGVIISTDYFSREAGDDLPHNVVEMARVHVAKKRHIQVGDKMAGRHGNKGVISNILPEEDMPFLPDGTPVDIILNPLGVPSRMNIGQVLENHLGLACSQIGMTDDEMLSYISEDEHIPAYDKHSENIAGDRNAIKFERRDDPLKVKLPVFLSPKEDQIRYMFDKLGLPIDGKTVLHDGLTGEPFKERVMVGVMYILKLNHLVDDKIHARSTGSYALITQQPLGGKAQFGGQRLGEMEVWALEGYGAAYLLKEMLTVKSDDVIGRNNTYKAIVDGRVIPEPGIPESFYVIVNELKSLGLDVTVFNEGEDVQDAVLGEKPDYALTGGEFLDRQ